MHEIEIVGIHPKKSARRTVRRILRNWMHRWSEKESLKLDDNFYVRLERMENEEVICTVLIHSGPKTWSGSGIGKGVSSALVSALNKVQAVYIMLPKKKKAYMERELSQSA